MTEPVTDPEETVGLQPTDLAETAVDEIDDFERPVPLEANDADVVEQKVALDDDEDGYDHLDDEQ